MCRSGRTCSAVDLVFIVAISESDSLYRQRYSYHFILHTVNQVAVNESQYKFAIVTFDDRASLNVTLRSQSVAEITRYLPYPLGGPRSNLRAALAVARTQAFSIDNGMRPPAYKAVIVLWDGRAPDAEFGTLVDEAPRLRAELGADVYLIVSDEHESQSRYSDGEHLK